MPNEMTAQLLITMNIATVFYLHPPIDASSNHILIAAGIPVKRLLLV
jgi:hypothetical protein